MPTMPIISNKAVSAVECNAAKCVARQVFNKRTGKLKAKKPYTYIDPTHPDAILHASANYIWRMLAFDLCNFAPHNCMPCTADWGIRRVFSKSTSDEREAWVDSLDDAIRQIESTIPAAEHKGAIEWGYALGLMNNK